MYLYHACTDVLYIIHVHVHVAFSAGSDFTKLEDAVNEKPVPVVHVHVVV